MIDIYFKSNDVKLAFDDMDIYFYSYTYPRQESANLTGYQKLLEICDKTSRNNEYSSSINCYLSPANYEKLMNFRLQHFQISVLTNKESTYDN